jgi:hypothetical protein
MLVQESASANRYVIIIIFELDFQLTRLILSNKQYAYNEMSFMIIRLLQSFSDISLDLASAPKEAVPPADWAKGTGRKAIEKVRPKNHLTMYASVSTVRCSAFEAVGTNRVRPGRCVGQDDRSY